MIPADFLIQSGLAKQIRFHGKRYPWFVSDVTKKDWEWLLNTMVYGHLFPKATEQERESLRRLGLRWKVRLLRVSFLNIDSPLRVRSNMSTMASGFMNNTLSGVLATHSGSCTARRRIFSCTCRVRTSSSSRVT